MPVSVSAETRAWIVAAGVFVGVLVVGLVLGAIASRRLRALAARTPARWDDVLAGSVRRAFVFGAAVLALASAVRILPLDAGTRAVLRTAVLVLAVLAIAVVLARVLSGLIPLALVRASGLSSSILTNVAVAAVYGVAGMIALQALGVSIAPLITALGIGGLAVALALQDTLSNLFAGLNIMMTRQVRMGDYIRVDTGDEGYVADITWRTTVVHSLGGSAVIVPNHKLAQAVVTNFHLPGPEMAVTVDVAVDYGSDLAQVEDVTRAVARETMAAVPGAVPGFEPLLRFHTFGENGIALSVILRCREYADQFLLKHEFIKRLRERYRRENILHLRPVRDVVVRAAPPPGAPPAPPSPGAAVPGRGGTS